MSEEQSYYNLAPERVAESIRILQKRVSERFPDSGLNSVAAELCNISNRAKKTTEMVSRPILSLRFASCLLIGLIGAGIVTTLATLELPKGSVKLVEFIQLLEAGINDVVLIGAAVFFVGTLEGRIKRARALAAIHELRSIAHVIDMHQLTKDPQRVLYTPQLTLTSPRTNMTTYELGRYLDYCSEMLSLTGKIAALYVQRFTDPVALSAVNEVETLTTGLSRKIWQKLMILHNRGDMDR